MAENKKSFVLYADLIHTVSKMPSEKAGDLFKHILSYVNDQNPETEDLIIQLTFEPIKQQLKRDLRKYETKKKQWSEAGKRSAEVRNAKKNERTLTDVENRSTDLTVSVNDSVNVNVINNKGKFDGYILEIQKHRQFTESWYMQHRVSKGTLQKLLNTFIISLGLKDFKEQPNNLGDFKKHFVNWCNTQDRLGKLTEYKKNKSKVKGAL